MAAIELLASGYGLIEGPCVDARGGLYFSDVPNGGVHLRAADGTIETIVPRRRGVGGIALHADGGIVISGRNICHVRDGESRILFDLENTPGWNDLAVDAQGRVYTGSMRSDPFSTTGERVAGECWRVDAEGRGTELYGGVELTNGIGFSPDGSVIYHCDTSRREITAHDLAADGSCSKRRAFATVERGLPDGLAVDAEGGVWIAAVRGGCVSRFTPDGKLDRHLDVPADQVTSLCFGGSDGRDLYVVSADHSEQPELAGCIFRTRSPFPGLALPEARI